MHVSWLYDCSKAYACCCCSICRCSTVLSCMRCFHLHVFVSSVFLKVSVSVVLFLCATERTLLHSNWWHQLLCSYHSYSRQDSSLLYLCIIVCYGVQQPWVILESNCVIDFQDRLGLQQMDKLGKLQFLSVDGDHLQFSEDWFIENIVDKYLK